MALLSAASLQAVFSTLFRICTYIYLRIIPVSVGRLVIPSLFGAYVLLWTIDLLYPSKPYSKAPNPLVGEKGKVDEAKASTNGDSSGLHVAVTDAADLTPRTSPPTINTIFFSLPTSNTLTKLISLLINIFLLTMVVDFTFRPLLNTYDDLVFTRVGAVYHDAAKIVVRYPGEKDGVRIVWKQFSGLAAGAANATVDDDESRWIEGPLVKLSPDQDWVGAVKLENLWTGTTYQYRLAAANSSLLPYPAAPISFKTFPDPRIPGTRFKFIASSCILPNFPYIPFTPSNRIKGFDLLHKQLHKQQLPPPPQPAAKPEDHSDLILPEDEKSSTPRPSQVSVATHADTTPHSPASPAASSAVKNATLSVSTTAAPTLEPIGVPPVSPVETEFMLLLGDFIYADVPRPVKDRKEVFLAAYRQIYASDDFRNVYEHLPIFNIYDDHEIRNDFNGHSDESAPLWKNASTTWSAYQGQANYDSHRVDENGPYYFEFTHGDVAFFVLDTRRYRSVIGADTSDGDSRTILGDRQMADFRKWIGKVNSTAVFKFVISSVPLTGMWGGPNGQIDTWMGAARERRALKELLEYVPNVVILSGDRHEFAAVEHIGAKPVYEFSVSPLSQFYIPFVPTFKESNAPKRTEWSKKNVTNEDGTMQIEDVPVDFPEEKMLKYIPHGNYKWGTIEVDTTDADKPTVTFELSIDGQKAWEYTIVGQPVKWSGSTSLSPSVIADSVTEGVKNVISRLGRIFAQAAP